MKKSILIILALLKFGSVYSQFSLNYKLEEKFDYSKLTEKYDLKTIDEIEVLDEQVVEFTYDKEGNLFEYYYIHQVTYVNSDNAIDRNNKIYINSPRITELVSYDVRVVLPNGSMKSMGKDALKEGTTEDKQKINYFAVSGAEKGGYIEYYYLVKRNANISGYMQNFQGGAEKAKIIFKVISPENLIFTSKSFNGFAELKADSSLSERNMLMGEISNVKKIEGESFGNEKGNAMKVVYQLYFNTAKGKKNPFNYGLVSQGLFENICNTISKNELKEINKMLKQSDIKFAPTEEAKIRAVENYVKKTFNFMEAEDERLQNIESIVKVGALNETGALRIIYHMINQLGIEQEIVVTSNRYKNHFDKDFESYVFLTDYLLYFPKIDKYLSPFSQAYRLGLVPYGFVENYGLFIKKVSIGDINTGAGKVKFINARLAKETQHNMYITAQMDNSGDSLNIDFKIEYTGYYAQNFQPYFDFVATDKIKEFEESIVKSLNENITIKKIKIENKGADNLMVNPLIVNSNLTSSHFLSKAGNKILLKFGDLIGPQSELYQENNRALPIENDYNREYHREITFIVPDGYTVKNANDLTMSVQPFKGEGDAASFTSSYRIEGNKLILKSDEYYNIINLPLKSYENFRAVVNAAANFNKIVLVLEKK